MSFESRFQIGKNGVTEGVIKSLNQDLKMHNRIRISVLKSAGREKDKIIKIAENIVSGVDYYCVYKLIGFTIILMRRSSYIKQK